MKIAKLAKKIMIASALGLSLISVPLLGSAGVGQASAATAAATASASVKAEKVIDLAQSLKGKVRYKYGVNNAKTYTFDCSSFTKYVFASVGVNLKWGSRSQSQQGKYVSKSSLKAGDLVFFKSSGGSKISHVGIYMGNGKFIHNTIGKNINGVLISNLSDYSSRYVTARRVL